MLDQALKNAIRDSGMSLKSLARETGVTLTVITRFMNDEASMRIDLAAKIADYLGLGLVPVHRRTRAKK